MEYSQSHKVSADEEEELMEKRSYYIFPCHFLEEAVRVFFKCLGIETKSQEDKDTDEINPEKITPNSEQLLDGAVPSLLTTYDDPPSSSSTETTDEAAVITRIKVGARERPGLSTGEDSLIQGSSNFKGFLRNLRRTLKQDQLFGAQ